MRCRYLRLITSANPLLRRSLLTDPFMADCKVVCGDKSWDLHKLILCTRSRYFKAAFTGNFSVSSQPTRTQCRFEMDWYTNERTQEATSNVVTFNPSEMDAQLLGFAIYYLYAGKCKFNLHLITRRRISGSYEAALRTPMPQS